MRGKGYLDIAVQIQKRITPACAGKSCPPQAPTFTRQDHPRVCGEKPVNKSSCSFRQGSPPRMQGEDIFPDGLPCAVRITPACAGKSGPAAWHRWACRDHPRMCGEKCPPGKFFFMTVGSPPRMRGKEVQGLLQELVGGITPACAGKRGSGSLPRSCRRDHPRVCGEKPFRSNHSTTSEGSPPRMRGKGPAGQILVVSVGITPACAGKRIKLRKRHSICGEKFHPASDRKLGRVQGTKRSSGPAPAAAPAGLAGSCPASPP